MVSILLVSVLLALIDSYIEWDWMCMDAWNVESGSLELLVIL